MTSLREAAQALLTELNMDTLDLSIRTEGAMRVLEDAIAAPPPGLEELRRKLRDLFDLGHCQATDEDWGVNSGARAKRDRLIAELLAMWERS